MEITKRILRRFRNGEKNREILTGYDFLVKKYARFTHRYIWCTLIYSEIASFAHERIRYMVICFSRYSDTTAKHADKVEPIIYPFKNITICLILFCAKEAIDT